MNQNNISSKLIAVVPTYNERQNIGLLVRTFFNILPSASLLVVDDNSPDKTVEEVADLKKEFPRLNFLLRHSERGLGKSYIDALKKLAGDNRYEIIVMMDADFSHDPRMIPGMLERLSQYKIVIGSRYVRGGGVANWNMRRKMLSRFANFYARFILGLSIKDMTAGFFVFDRSVLSTLDLNSIKSEGYAFLIELKYRFSRLGYEIYEYPVIVSDRTQGQSKISKKVIWESIWLPWKLKLRKIQNSSSIKPCTKNQD